MNKRITGRREPLMSARSRRIWDICNYLTSESDNVPARRRDVLRQAVLDGIVENTASSEYNKWRIYHGLKTCDNISPCKCKTK